MYDQTWSAIRRSSVSDLLGFRGLRPLMLALAVAGTTVLAALTFLFLTRRVSGGMVEPLPALVAGLLSLSLACGSAIVRVAGMLSWLQNPHRLDRRLAWMLFVVPGWACFVAALAVTVPSATPAADSWLFVPLALGEAISLAIGAWMIRNADRVEPGLFPWRPSPQRSVRPSRAWADASSKEGGLPGDVTQHLVRCRLPDGVEAYRGWLRVAFSSGQRQEVLHVAFCPPFETTPQWSASAVEGAALTIKQVQVYPYGARLEVRLNQAFSQPTQSVLRFQAVEVRGSTSRASC